MEWVVLEAAANMLNRGWKMENIERGTQTSVHNFKMAMNPR